VKALRASLGLALLLTACLGDPAGPGVLDVAVLGVGVDTVWVGAPGEPLSTPIRIHVTDDQGRPLSGAALEWEAVGRNAQVLAPTAQSDRSGLATAGWQLGTDAAEAQQLRVTVRSRGTEGQIVIRARAVPYVVAQLRIALDTPAVVRLGDTLPVRAIATDPYGNEFPAPGAALFVLDSTVGSALGDRVVAGPRRGHTTLRATSQGISAGASLHVKQYVAAIEPMADTLRFSALGAQRPVAYVVRDDRGRVVADTAAEISIADGADGVIAQVDSKGEYVRAVALGFTTLRLALGPASAAIVVGVQQRVGSLALVRDTIRLDALLDTTTVVPIAHDSLGSPIAQPALVYEVSDQTVARFATARTLEAVKPGAALVTVRDSTSNVSTSAPVVVRQVIASIDFPSQQISFDALGDTLTLSPVARDRLGSIVPGASLTYSVADSGVAAVGSGSQLRSVAPGQTQVVVTDPETGIVGTAVVRVVQRAATIRLALDTASFDALGDTVQAAFSAWDRLGAVIANASATYRSTNPSVVAVSADGQASSQNNGSALLIAESADGPADTAQVTVAQRVTAIVLGRDTLSFESLRAVQAAQVVPVDRRGAPVPSAAVAYTVEDTTIAAVDQAGQVQARANGATRLLAVADGNTGVIDLLIAQRPVRVLADTIRFDALGDVKTVSAVALDSLGSPVSGGVTSVTVADSAVALASDSVTVVARGNGVSTASVTVAGISGEAVVVVDQVAATLDVAVTFGNPIVTLPAGATLPLSCVASDRNGYAIARETGLVRTVKGTVTGNGCADATIQRSGYDTLVFAMGAAQARVPVIVATRPDSVGVVAAAWPLATDERIHFVGEDLANPSILALRPLVADILADYGNPTSNLDRARAIRDWVARTAIYPDGWVRPDTTTSNLSVLPPGKTWVDVTRLLTLDRWNADATYWRQFYADGYRVLDRLLGTLDQTTGLRAEDGMMEHVAGSRYRIRDVDSYHYLACSFQAFIVNALWAAAGLHGTIVPVLDHDPTAVFIPELGRWVYEDATYNEEYLLDGVGEPLSPLDLLAVSTAGQSGRLHAVKMRGPSFDPAPYPPVRAYVDAGMHPEGMIIMGAGLYRRWVGDVNFAMHYVMVDVQALHSAPAPWGDPNLYAPVAAEVAFPMLAPMIVEVSVEDSVQVVRLASTFPNHQRFERRLAGQDWEGVSDVDVLPVGATKVEYRSLDAIGNISASALVDVWAPRTEDFVQSAPSGSIRAQARYWVSP
jgi:hypothetical protein